jgi:hypothetical protein
MDIYLNIYTLGSHLMYTESITMYCVRYDAYLCDCDPERLWEVVQRSGGGVSAMEISGYLDFHVPASIITQVMLMDSGLKVRIQDSYI